MARENADDALLSYGSPRRSFSANVSSSSVLGAAGGDGLVDAPVSEDAQALLAFYRQRCEEFQRERQATLDHVARIEVSKEEFHRLKWELRMKSDEIAELEELLKKANATLFGVKSELVDVQAANKKLRLQEEKDRLKIQHLLALTQPITEEVTFFRDCRPGTSASYPITPAQRTTPQTYSYPSTMHISSEIRRSNPRKQSQPPARIVAATTSRASVRASTSAAQTNKVLRTVYLPNEQAAMLAKTVESLEQQLVAHHQLTDERIQTLLDEFATEKAKLMQRKSHLEDNTQVLERQLEKTQRLLHQTTKDYLVLRHQSQESERLAHEELHQLHQQCETLSHERRDVIQQAVIETQALKKSVQEEGNVCAEEFRSQALSRERDLHILKEQYAAVQEACTHRIQDLQARLTKLRSRYRSLDKRRAMEMEGFTRDVVGLKRHLQKLEVMHYGRRLTGQERQSLRVDEHYTLDSNELSEEVAALQHRVMELQADLASFGELDSWRVGHDAPASHSNFHLVESKPSILTTSQTMKTHLAAALVALAVCGQPQVLADDTVGFIEIGASTFSGKGCEPPSDVSVALSTDGKWLQVAFPKTFYAESGESSTHTRVACNGVIPVAVPKGYAVGISKDALQGFVSIPDAEDATHYAQVSSEFFFASQGRGSKVKQRFTVPEVAQFSVDALSDTIWSSCGAPATLRINTALIADGDASAIGFSSSTDGLRLAVSYRKCASAEDDKAEETENTKYMDE